ncbi:hypothetical protein WAI453_005860 [Rhynchosporium graminicola]
MVKLSQSLLRNKPSCDLPLLSIQSNPKQTFRQFGTFSGPKICVQHVVILYSAKSTCRARVGFRKIGGPAHRSNTSRNRFAIQLSYLISTFIALASTVTAIPAPQAQECYKSCSTNCMQAGNVKERTCDSAGTCTCLTGTGAISAKSVTLSSKASCWQSCGIDCLSQGKLRGGLCDDAGTCTCLAGLQKRDADAFPAPQSATMDCYRTCSTGCVRADWKRHESNIYDYMDRHWMFDKDDCASASMESSQHVSLRDVLPSLPPAIITVNKLLAFRSLRWCICATRALQGSGASSSSAICVLLTCITKALAGLGALLTHVLAGSKVSSYGSGGLLLLFRPRFPLITFAFLSTRIESAPLGGFLEQRISGKLWFMYASAVLRLADKTLCLSYRRLE